MRFLVLMSSVGCVSSYLISPRRIEVVLRSFEGHMIMDVDIRSYLRRQEGMSKRALSTCPNLYGVHMLGCDFLLVFHPSLVLVFPIVCSALCIPAVV